LSLNVMWVSVAEHEIATSEIIILISLRR
jgi:hypothetical protein